MQDKLLTTVEAATLLGCSPGSLANLRAFRRGMPYTKDEDGRVFYRASAVASWLAGVRQ